MSHTWRDRSQTASMMVNGKAITTSRNLVVGLRALSRSPAVVQGKKQKNEKMKTLDVVDRLSTTCPRAIPFATNTTHHQPSLKPPNLSLP